MNFFVSQCGYISVSFHSFCAKKIALERAYRFWHNNVAYAQNDGSTNAEVLHTLDT